MEKSESEVQKECLSILTLYNIFHWRQNSGGLKGGYKTSYINGVSDILGILPDGRFLAIECKRSKGGIVSEDQKRFLSNIEKNNGVALVINDSQILIQKLNEILKR